MKRAKMIKDMLWLSENSGYGFEKASIANAAIWNKKRKRA